MANRIGEHFRGNVVAYVALFLALGTGAAWALDRNSVKSKHIAPNAVKGKDAKESSFGPVPRAKNALNLDGLDSSAFERANRVQFGQAENDVTTDEVVLSWPALGVSVLNDGDTGVADQEVRLLNTLASGYLMYTFRGQAGAGAIPVVGGIGGPNPTVPIDTSAAGPGVIISDEAGSLVMMLECGYGPGPSEILDRVNCFAIRSEP